MVSSIQIGEISRIAEQLAPLCDGDNELMHDMMQGESNIDNLMASIYEQIARDEETLEGIKARFASLKARKERIEHRRETFRAAVGKILRAAQLPKLEMAEATFSVRDGKSKLVITDKEAVPQDMCAVKYEPDRTLINATYAQSESLPNWLTREPPQDVITIRTK